MRHVLVALIVLVATSGTVLAQVDILNEDFEGDLSVWAGVGNGIIVMDPLDSANQALAFTRTAAGGDMWSEQVTVNTETAYTLSFRYLGNAGGADTGGYLWLVDPLYGNVDSCPVWGTQPENSHVELIDDGTWHSYELTFYVRDFFDPIGGTLQVVVEDWNGAAGSNPPPNVPGDAFFDDIRIRVANGVGNELVTWGKIKTLFR